MKSAYRRLGTGASFMCQISFFFHLIKSNCFYSIALNVYYSICIVYFMHFKIISSKNMSFKALLHGAINCIYMQLKSTKRAIDCSSLQFLVSQHVLKFIAQTSNFTLSVAKGTIAFEPRECVTHLLRQRTRISMQLLIIII